MEPDTTNLHDTAKALPTVEKCESCSGSGYVATPDLTNVSMARIARGAARSPALISRMFSDTPGQKRPNPTLRTMRKICKSIEASTGVRYSLDQLAKAIES